MTQITFENSRGILRLGGGSDSIWRMTAVTGLGMSAKSFQTAACFTEAGQRTISERRQARTITLSGDLYAKEADCRRRMEEAIRILDIPGWLLVRSGGKARRIWGRCTNFEETGRMGPYRKWVMQFCCDCPYFEKVGNDSIALFKRQKEIKGEFTLPQYFSTRVSEGVVVNTGDVEAEPVLYIYFGIGTKEDEEITLTLKNERTESTLDIKLTPKVGDTVTVDVAARKVYNGRGENLITSLSKESRLGSFYLATGVNKVSAVTSSYSGLSVVCRFTNRYLEAVS